MSRSKAAAFFDLDRTLIDVNSAILYAQFEYQAGRLGYRQLALTVWDSILYHFNILDMERAYARALLYYRGLPESELAARSKEFFGKKIRDRLLPGARQALDEHRRAGHPLVLLSTSSSFQAELAKEAWGLDHWIATRFHVKGGRMEGGFVHPLCYGEGKVILAKRWAEKENVDLKLSYFYSDSFSDRPMLESVGNPVAVNPDPKLRRLAIKKNWPIVDWRYEAARFGLELIAEMQEYRGATDG